MTRLSFIHCDNSVFNNNGDCEPRKHPLCRRNMLRAAQMGCHESLMRKEYYCISSPLYRTLQHRTCPTHFDFIYYFSTANQYSNQIGKMSNNGERICPCRSSKCLQLVSLCGTSGGKARYVKSGVYAGNES